MPNLGPSIRWGLVVAASLLAGALAAVRLRLPERAAAALTAFGGGVLLAAVALELVPDADAYAGTALTAVGLVAGTLVYVGADAWLSREEHIREMRPALHASSAGRPEAAMRMAAEGEGARGLSIAAGLFIDGVPESLALGLTIAEANSAWPCWRAVSSATWWSPTAPRSRSSPAGTRAASRSASSA